MSPAPATLWGALVGAVAMLVLLQGTLSQMHTTVEVFDDSCDAQLQSLWNNYTAPPGTPTFASICYGPLRHSIVSPCNLQCGRWRDVTKLAWPSATPPWTRPSTRRRSSTARCKWTSFAACMSTEPRGKSLCRTVRCSSMAPRCVELLPAGGLCRRTGGLRYIYGLSY